MAHLVSRHRNTSRLCVFARIMIGCLVQIFQGGAQLATELGKFVEKGLVAPRNTRHPFFSRFFLKTISHVAAPAAHAMGLFFVEFFSL
jgi:hypothetical protein